MVSWKKLPGLPRYCFLCAFVFFYAFNVLCSSLLTPPSFAFKDRQALSESRQPPGFVLKSSAKILPLIFPSKLFNAFLLYHNVNLCYAITRQEIALIFQRIIFFRKDNESFRSESLVIPYYLPISNPESGEVPLRPCLRHLFPTTWRLLRRQISWPLRDLFPSICYLVSLSAWQYR